MSTPIQKIKKILVVLAMTVAAFMVFVTIIPILYPQAEAVALPARVTQFEQTSTSEESIVPERITIPDIGIDASVEKLGVTKQNTIMSPKKRMNVGWYSYGPKPGDRGTAIFAGHFNWIGGLDAVFAELDKVKTDDEIFVYDANGTELRFRVREIKTVKYTDAEYLNDLINAQNRNQIALITCSGDWIVERESFNERLIVIAEKVE